MPKKPVGNRTGPRGHRPRQTIIIPFPLAQRFQILAPDADLTETTIAALTTLLDEKERTMHEQLLEDLWNFMTHWPARYPDDSPSVMEVMGEFGLTYDEAIAALKEIGERHPRESQATDARSRSRFEEQA